MTTYPAVLIASVALLSSACLSQSNNVGEIPGESETESAGTGGTTEGETEPGESVGTSTGGASAQSTSTMETATEETGAEASTGMAEGGCLNETYECFFDEYEPLECESITVCDVLTVNDPSLNEFDKEPFGFINPDAAVCILDGLAAGTVGEYRIEVEPGQQNSVSYRLEVLVDGSLITRRHEQEDKSCDGSDRRMERQPVEFFDACQAETDEVAVFDCLVGAGNLEVCIDDGRLCPE